MQYVVPVVEYVVAGMLMVVFAKIQISATATRRTELGGPVRKHRGMVEVAEVNHVIATRPTCGPHVAPRLMFRPMTFLCYWGMRITETTHTEQPVLAEDSGCIKRSFYMLSSCLHKHLLEHIQAKANVCISARHSSCPPGGAIHPRQKCEPAHKARCTAVPVGQLTQSQPASAK